MTISETLHHILHLTLSWIRHQKPQNRSSAFIETPQSISTPLGVASRYRHVDAHKHAHTCLPSGSQWEFQAEPDKLTDGIARAKKRQYVGGKCKRVGE